MYPYFNLKRAFKKGPSFARFWIILIAVIFVDFTSYVSEHNPGRDCFVCHQDFAIGGTVFTQTSGTTTQPSLPVTFLNADGGEVVLDNTDTFGNFFSPTVPDGRYLFRIGDNMSRTWHDLPARSSCNTCHEVDGSGSNAHQKQFPVFHTRIPPDNDCTHCHHYPATMSLSDLSAPGVLTGSTNSDLNPTSQVDILGRVFPFDPDDYNISTARPDIFADGYYSMFDVILAVAAANDIRLEYVRDPGRNTHFVTKIDGSEGEYWYHFSYDTGRDRLTEMQYRRANRWDEALWRPGVWIQVVEGENLDEIKGEYREEILRENALGHVIPQVRISMNPTSYQGNPADSDRITFDRVFENVQVTAHDMRSVGYPSPYSKPFQPGVVTAMDVLYSLMDQRYLDLVTSVFYAQLGGFHIDSYFVVAMGFPDVGTAHASGRQGFVYTTDNGTYERLPNHAENNAHITSDILVIHAPDFAYWHWLELGNPYYETELTTGLEDASIQEDFAAISRGFNLHKPWPNPFQDEVSISFNIMEPGLVNLSIYDNLGRHIHTLLDQTITAIGPQRLLWQPSELTSGTYYVVLKHDSQMQVRSVIYIK